MAQTEIPSYKRMDDATSNTKAKKPDSQVRLKRGDYISGIICLLLARTSMLGAMSPFASAFFASSYTRAKMPLTLLCSLIGMLSAGMGTKAFKYLLAMCIFYIYKLLFDKRNSKPPALDALISALSLFCGGMIVMLYDMLLIYNVALLTLESIICGFICIIFKEANVFIAGREKAKGYIANEQLISLLMIASLCVAGLSDITSMGPVNLSHIVCAICVIFLAYCRGMAVGTCAGACAGIVCAINSLDMLFVIGIYTLCGFCAGAAKPLGKYGVSVAFASTSISIGFITTMYIYGNVGILNFLIASVIFMMFPRKKLERIAAFVNGYCSSRSDIPYLQKMRELIHLRLGSQSEAFNALAQSFDDLSLNHDSEQASRITQVFDNAAQKVCAKCGLRGHCWDKEGDITADAISAIKKKLLDKGYADILDVPSDFRQKCAHCSEFVASANHFYEISRINTLWEGQLNEARKILSQQYRGFASVMDILCEEMTNDILCESKYEKKISDELLKNKISLKSICVFERADSGFEVETEFYDTDDLVYTDTVGDVISHVLSQPMRMRQTLHGDTHVIFEPQLNYKIVSGVATLKKDGQKYNGDSYCTVSLGDNRYALAISDGMGCGEQASCESSIAINLLKKLLLAGFDKTAAITLVNSALVSKNGAEAFATIDLSIIDLVSARVEFVKIGAVAGYIKHDDNVETIFCSTLPAGILSDADLSLSSKHLISGDLIVMMSDGISNAKKNSNWVKELLLSTKQKDEPEAIAEIILKEAVIHKHGHVDDDMTVIVARILEK